MNVLDPHQTRREAVIRYLDADFQIVREGDHVRCASSGKAIPWTDLRYWNVSLQQPYGSAEAAFRERVRSGS